MFAATMFFLTYLQKPDPQTQQGELWKVLMMDIDTLC